MAEMLTNGAARSIREIAEREASARPTSGCCYPSASSRRALVEQVLTGRQPQEFTAGRLVWNADVPVKW